MNETQSPSYIASLFKAAPTKAQGRKVWSIDLETVWLPFFSASNTTKVTAIPHDALGAPLRLAYNPDGSVRFSKAGKPVIRVAKDISDNVKLVRDNFVAGLQNYSHEVYTANEQGYKDMVKACVEAGKPITDHDKAKLNDAMAKTVKEAIAQAEAKEAEAKAEAEVKETTEAKETTEVKPETERELVPA